MLGLPLRPIPELSRNSRPVARDPQFSFGGSSFLRSERGSGRASIRACRLAKPASVRLQISEYLPITDFNFHKNLIDSCEHSTSQRPQFLIFFAQGSGTKPDE